MLTHFSHSSQFHKILIIQNGTVRDIIRILPIVNILRLRFPHVKIAWLASPEMIDFLNHYNIADRIIVAKPGWYKKLYEIKALRKKLRSFAPDLCLDLQGTVSSGFAAKFSGCDKRISIHGTKSRLFDNLKKSEQAVNQLEKHLNLLESLGVAGASIDYDFPEIFLERRESGRVLRELGLESTPFAMFSIGVQSYSTHWEIERYVQVAEHLWQTHHLPTVAVWQFAKDKQIAEKIENESGGMVALAPLLSAIPLVALARKTSVFVGTDSDFLHIAAAVGAPCIGILCDENARRDAPCCNNFQAVMATMGKSRWKRRGIKAGASPVRIDNYTYDVIQVCNACDDILQPVVAPATQKSIQISLSENRLVKV